MNITCRLIEEPESYSSAQPGDMWYIDRELDQLSQFYRDNNQHRKPIMVKLPSNDYFCIDAPCYSQERGSYGGWTVTGEAPNISVSPSINLVDRWHGFLTGGVLTGC